MTVASPSPNLILAREGSVLVATFNRPDKKNALTRDMYDGLRAAMQEAEADQEIGALLIAGAGGNFTSGNDIGDFLARAASGSVSPATTFIEYLPLFQKPIVAAVDGVAIGVGMTMLFHCDLVYAAPDTVLRMPFIDLGLVPEAGSSLTVPHRVGMAKASELLLLGEPLNAAEALRLNVVNGVVDGARLHAHALAKAQALAAKPRQALMATRRLLRGDGAALSARITEEIDLFAKAIASDEARAAFMAFMSRSKR